MLTKLDVICAATNEFLSNYKFTSLDSIKDARNKLLGITNQKYQERNINEFPTDKKNWWKLEDNITVYQVARIINFVFKTRKIRVSEDTEYGVIFGIYINDVVINISNGKYEKYRGLYRTEDLIVNEMIDFVDEGITPKDKRIVKDYLFDMSGDDIVGATDDKDLIAVNNGIFHYDTKELEAFTPDYVFLTKSCVNYNPNAVSPIITMPNGEDWEVETWMSDLNDDPAIVNLFWEITSALLRPHVRWNMGAFLMSSTGANGKGTLVEMWRSLLGDEAHCSIALTDFSERFALTQLIGKSAIITDENDVGGYLDKAANLKAVITSDMVYIDRKNKDPIKYRPHLFVVQCLNDLPRIKDKSDSFFRRQLFIPMTKCFTGIEIPEIKNDYLHREEVLEYVMKKALETNFYKLSEPESCKIALEEYKEYNDPVRQFWNELRDEFKWDLLPFPFLYDLFTAWFRKNNPSGTVIGKSTFTNDLLAVIRNDRNWFCEDKRKQIRVSQNNMNGPEPLIVEYDLKEWMSTTHKGRNKDLLAIPVLADRYRGILRIGSTDDSNEE